jgi:hypothetical protein
LDILAYSRMSKNIQEYSRMFKDIQESMNILGQNGPGAAGNRNS